MAGYAKRPRLAAGLGSELHSLLHTGKISMRGLSTVLRELKKTGIVATGRHTLEAANHERLSTMLHRCTGPLRSESPADPPKRTTPRRFALAK